MVNNYWGEKMGVCLQIDPEGATEGRFFSVGELSLATRFNIILRALGDSSNALLRWLMEAWKMASTLIRLDAKIIMVNHKRWE